jgi:hypothetical protein
LPFQGREHQGKKVVVVKDQNEKGEKDGKNSMDGEIHLIVLRGEMELEFFRK